MQTGKQYMYKLQIKTIKMCVTKQQVNNLKQKIREQQISWKVVEEMGQQQVVKREQILTGPDLQLPTTTTEGRGG